MMAVRKITEMKTSAKLMGNVQRFCHTKPAADHPATYKDPGRHTDTENRQWARTHSLVCTNNVSWRETDRQTKTDREYINTYMSI